jgi:2'-5' RNA ligase
MEDFFTSVVGRWPAGREDYHWHVLPDTGLLGERVARPYRELTHQEGLAPVRAPWLHVTVAHFAPVTEISDGELAAITGLVRDRCAGIAPFAVTAGRAEAWGGGIVCPLRPGALLRELWQVTTDAAAAVTGNRFPVLPPVYYPHLTLAYATSHVDHGPVRAWLSDAEVAEVALPVTALVLVAQQHDGCEITWRVTDGIPLAVGTSGGGGLREGREHLPGAAGQATLGKDPAPAPRPIPSPDGDGPLPWLARHTATTASAPVPHADLPGKASPDDQHR